ncbi:DgyrCDS2156 [Dimorphilus gyrociliatus]|uniref:DgyrCDS2156 n=1 Tax=Dimorphilus gyrociliatus TaxID=2664684 RepID=A0A7I8V9M6_9ANNE|nr:DgyrCDS2156 [Dimorphilus gyrociliatus]
MAFIRSLLKTKYISHLKIFSKMEYSSYQPTKSLESNNSNIQDINGDWHSNTNDLDEKCLLIHSNLVFCYSFKNGVDSSYKNLIGNTLPYFFAVAFMSEEKRENVKGHLIDKPIVEWPTHFKRHKLDVGRWRRLEGFVDMIPQIESNSTLSIIERLEIALNSMKLLVYLEDSRQKIEMNDLLEEMSVQGSSLSAESEQAFTKFLNSLLKTPWKEKLVKK